MPRRILTGEVVSDKMNKTIVVLVNKQGMDKVTGKRVKRSKRYKVHDEENKSKVGDTVKIRETIPISKEKTWELFNVVERNILDEEEIEAVEKEGGEVDDLS